MLVLALHLILVVGFTLRLVLRDELAPPSRLAWFVVILTLPIAGSVLYVLFGEIDPGRAAAARARAIAGARRARAVALFGEPRAAESLLPRAWRAPFACAASINGFAPVGGNRAELMADGTSARARLIADIDAARTHVHVLYYIWLDDETGTNVARALVRAAGRGVACRAMADGLGSRAFVRSPLWREMGEAGVELRVALPLDRPIRTLLASRLDLRNHRKITVVDGRVAHVGSQNCADAAFLPKARYAPWVDIMVRVEGPVVAQQQLLFAGDWIRHGEGRIEDFDYPLEPREDGFVAQAMGAGPTERALATPHLFATLMHAARTSLTVSTPYFVPDAVVLEALRAAAFRGVAVTLILPARNDSGIVAAASRASYARLLDAGVRLFEFEEGLLHAKTLTVDDALALVGSSNMDLRSFDLNEENNLLMHDAAIVRAVRARQDDYIARASEVTREEVARWPRWLRIRNNVVATLGPVL